MCVSVFWYGGGNHNNDHMCRGDEMYLHIHNHQG